MRLELAAKLNENPQFSDFSVYEKSLQKEVRLHPENIDAWTLLAYIKLETSDNAEQSVRYLKKALRMNERTISHRDYAILATNIAYNLYHEPINENSIKDSDRWLKNAADRHSPFAETYYALGQSFYWRNNFDKAAGFLKIADEKSDSDKYKLPYAVCLLQCGNYQEAESILTNLPETADSRYFSAVLAYRQNDYEKTRQILQKMREQDDKSEWFDDYNLADFYYVMDDYETYVSLIDAQPYTLSAAMTPPYFYSKFALHQEAEAAAYLQSMIAEKEEDIRQSVAADFESLPDYKEYLADSRAEIDTYQYAYENAKTGKNRIAHSILIFPKCVGISAVRGIIMKDKNGK